MDVIINDQTITNDRYNKKVNNRKPIFGIPLNEVLLIEYSETGVPEVLSHLLIKNSNIIWH